MKCYDTSVQFKNELIEFIKRERRKKIWRANYLSQQKKLDELEKQGFVVVKGKISRKYFEERVYGMSETK